MARTSDDPALRAAAGPGDLPVGSLPTAAYRSARSFPDSTTRLDFLSAEDRGDAPRAAHRPPGALVPTQRPGFSSPGRHPAEPPGMAPHPEHDDRAAGTPAPAGYATLPPPEFLAPGTAFRGLPAGYRTTGPLSARVGGHLREARHRAALSQRDLAEVSGIPRSTIGRIECGNAPDPRIRTLCRLFEAVGCRLVVLPAHDAPDRFG